MDTIKCISPVDGSVYIERPLVSEAEIGAAMTAARGAQMDWAALSLEARATYCSAIVEAMRGMQDEIIPELAWQMGRPVRYGAGELAGFAERARHMIAIAAEALAAIETEPKEGFERYIERVPLGIVFVIAPWNYPYLTAVNSVIPALMAGNTVILKHAAQTLAVGERFTKACEMAGLPEGVFTNLVLSHAQTASIIESGRLDQINFTGSVMGGHAICKAAGGTFTSIGLELGGKDPAYVRSDANLEYAVENLVDGAFFNSGQSCCGIERIYVDASLYDDFIEAYAALTRKYVLDDPLQDTTTLGPMVKPAAADFVRGQISAALNAGAKTLIDPSRFDRNADGSAYMAPQVLIGVDHSMTVMRDESFGPVVGIMKTSSDDEAIALMNDSEFGLSASIWTVDLDAAKSLGRRVETGTLFMNRCDALDPALAWTGIKNSGRGATLSRLGYDMLTRPKSFHLKHTL